MHPVITCYACIRYEKGKCEAFPEGIPEGILPGGFDHRKPWSGQDDDKILFDPIKED